jgi:NNP family nitrate/nitrite transporter-like MFS transporter
MNNEIISKYGLRGNPQSGLAMATFGYFIGFAAVSLYGPVAKNFNNTMHLSGLMLGLFVAAPNLTGSLLRIPFGAWVDRAGGKKPMLTLLLLSLVGMAGLSMLLYLCYPAKITHSMFPLIFLLGLLSGCGIATFSVGVPQTSYWFPQKKQGSALGIYGGIGNMAPGIFGIILPIALNALGLTGAYMAWFLFLLIGTVIYFIFAKDAYYFQLIKKDLPQDKAKELALKLGEELFPSGKVIESLKISARIRETWLLVAMYFISFGGFLALTAWFPTYWIELHGLGLRNAGLLMAFGFSILASLVRVYGGTLSDKIGGEKTSIMGFMILFAGSIILVFASHFYVALLGEIVMGVGTGLANAAVFKLMPKYVSKAPGGAGGWVGGLGAFGGFVVPPLLGIFIDIFGKPGYAKGFILFCIFAIIGVTIGLVLFKNAKKAGK